MRKDEDDIYEIVTTNQIPMISNHKGVSSFLETLIDPIMKPYYISLITKAKTEYTRMKLQAKNADTRMKLQLKEKLYFKLVDIMTELGMQGKLTPEMSVTINSQLDQILKEI